MNLAQLFESDMSGVMHAAKHHNKSFIITAEVDGAKKKFRVNHQNATLAKDKFLQHHSMAKILNVQEEGVAEAGAYGIQNPAHMSPQEYDRYQQDQMDYNKRDFKRREHEAEWEQEKAYSAKLAAQDAGTWYIRINGKILKDKQGNPYTFRGKASANKAALTMQAKPFNQGKQFMLTTNPNDISQGVAEGLSKRDQQDVAAIKAAIERLQAQLSHPNADKTAIQQSIAHEKKRLALYGQGVAEGFDGEYDDEAGMADNNLETLKRAVQGLDNVINAGDNLPEWCQEKIAVSKSMLVSVWDYMLSEKEKN